MSLPINSASTCLFSPTLLGAFFMQAALESMKKKLEVYKRESANLLSSYDTW